MHKIGQLLAVGAISILIAFAMLALARFEAEHQPQFSNFARKIGLIKMQSLSDLYSADFSNYVNSEKDSLISNRAGNKVEIKLRVYFDVVSGALFVSYYVPQSANTYESCVGLASRVKEQISLIENQIGKSSVSLSADSPMPIEFDELTFTGRVFIYHDTAMSPRQIADLVDLFKAQGLTLHLRGWEYQYLQYMGSSIKAGIK